MTILHQSLLALTYLHEQKPSIVHREIKPQNILVQSRDPLQVKLADFGLSKAGDYLSTLCGTHTYLAPEIARYYGSNRPEGVKYGNAVDIWSLGVVIFEYAYDLPHPGSGAGLPWCEEIISALDDWDSDGLIDLLSTMIFMDPKLRKPARECLRRASQLHVPGCCLTPTPASCSLQQGQIEDDDGSTTIILGNLWGTQGAFYQDNSEISSSYSVGIKRQRSPAVESTNTSFSKGRTKRRHHNGLFKQLSDGQIVDVDTPLDDDATEVATEAGTEIATPDANTSDDKNSYDGAVTPKQRSLAGSGISNTSDATTILIRGPWGSGEIDRQDSANSPSGRLTPARMSSLGPLTRWQRTPHTSSWSLTIGVGNSDSESRYEDATGIYLRKDHFTQSFKSQFTYEDEPQEENTRVGQESPALAEPEQGTAEPVALASFEQRILQIKA